MGIRKTFKPILKMCLCETASYFLRKQEQKLEAEAQRLESRREMLATAKVLVEEVLRAKFGVEEEMFKGFQPDVH